MKKLLVMSIFLIFFVSSISAYHSINYQIIGDKTLVEMNLGEVSDFEIKLPVNFKVLEVNSEYDLIDNVLKVNNSDNLIISYITDSLIEKTSSRNLFIINNNFGDSVSIILTLPEKAIVGDLIVPNADAITTNGKTISLIWNDFVEEEIVVAYEPVFSINWFYLLTLILLIGLFLGYFIYLSIKFKKKLKKVVNGKPHVSRVVQKARIKKEVTRNLYGEEKKIVEYLMDKKGKECWTKEIVRDVEISKVRLSRKLRSLVQRGLIEKTPYGNENRIKLLKKR